jgi:hypothetical protein
VCLVFVETGFAHFDRIGAALSERMAAAAGGMIKHDGRS